MLLAASATAAFAASPAAVPDTNVAVGEWLSSPTTGFAAWRDGKAAVVKRYDSFLCDPRLQPTDQRESFPYAGSACPILKSGTRFVYGPAGPTRGHVVYDRTRRIALFEKGCCAWRSFALVTNVAPPPKPVSSANLAIVRTARGVTLGMTQAQLKALYGPAKSYGTRGMPGVTTLSYTTMTEKSTEPGGDACGQFQSFSFRDNRLTSIELLAGC